MESQSLAIYRDAWGLTREMLNSAREGDWDALLEFEVKRNALLENPMAKGEILAEVNVAEQKQLATFIRDILAADAETRTLAGAWMGELQNILSSIGTEKKLSKAYGTP